MENIKVKCPCCGKYIKVKKRNSKYIAIPFFNIHSPTQSELERLGIELASEGGDKIELRENMFI